ncbi:TrmH family RNA methyltransferase [Aquimarina sp. EL_43]|uniref:TrmH family RNA methyltransferase n=1 Tax=unclassified Aquimarina TaxID=2627091 RepID=UPI0018C933E0|nr:MULTISPECIES: RNA methyltransferase [unclassified Aquimarina]MBG6131261.1 TrmH family RNA methyltransferase [Aquimarina sp. EL_35]MBG6151857.1 TrmH family RNA methyltransferase [Aquimarina sp. EL_32]MBG6169787.1 TrmH family RNA methyltransferase [Aquimarina sp. EL_43]
MVSKNQKKLIKSLYQKKYRKQHGLFVAEGKKVIKELLAANLRLHSLFTLEVGIFDVSTTLEYGITEEELKQISFLTTPQVALAVFHIPEVKTTNSSGLILALDDIRDPGNLGTIIRLCDWFGIQDLVCSLQTVDCYNPKVVQATMGSITRVNISYVNLKDFLTLETPNSRVFGTFMNGNSIYTEKLPKDAIVIMGNEANGISEDIQSLIKDRITIPQFGSDQKTESLNVATATAIVLSEFRRS